MLTQNQLSTIDCHLRKENWLLNEDLIAELTDHYVAGIDERMTHGSSFETAIREIHAGFGGRKGLLAMEEGFQKTQAKSVARQIRQRFTGYFRMPRLLTTGLLLSLIYTALKLLPIINDGSAWGDSMAWMSLGGLGLLYVLAYAHLIWMQKQKSPRYSVTQFLWPMVQMLNVLFFGGFYVNLFLPVEQMAFNYPLPVALFVTLVLLFELATLELLLERMAGKRKAKLA